jgi:hypothetical protein
LAPTIYFCRLDGFGRSPTLVLACGGPAGQLAGTLRLQPKEQTMKKLLAALVACGLVVTPSLAASAAVESASKTFDQVAADPGKLKTYCEMSKLMNESGDEQEGDAAKDDALDKQMQGYMKELGSDFESAFEAGADLDPESADGKAYDAALDKLDSKCK